MKNSRLAAFAVSKLDSISNFPLGSITATEIVLDELRANILFAVHEGAPFVGHEVNDHNLPPRAPFYDAITTVESGFAPMSLWTRSEPLLAPNPSSPDTRT